MNRIVPPRKATCPTKFNAIMSCARLYRRVLIHDEKLHLVPDQGRWCRFHYDSRECKAPWKDFAWQHCVPDAFLLCTSEFISVKIKGGSSYVLPLDFVLQIKAVFLFQQLLKSDVVFCSVFHDTAGWLQLNSAWLLSQSNSPHSTKATEF